MTDMNTNPPDPKAALAEKYADAKIVDEKPETPAPSGGDDVKARLAKKYAGWQTHENVNDIQRIHASRATEKALKTGKFGNPTQDHTWVDWVGDAARSTILGPLGDAIGAQVLSLTHEGVSYRDAMEAIRRGRAEKGVSTTAQIVGSVVGGGMIYKAGKHALTAAATKSGMVDGAIKAASSQNWFKAAAASAAAGGSIGAVEEGIRSTLEEAVDASAGMAFDGDRVAGNILAGAFIGAAASPAIDAAGAGIGWARNYLRRLNPDSEAATESALRRIVQAQRGDDNMDVAGAKFREKVQGYIVRHGKMPSAAQVMTPEQVAAVAEVSRSFTGLDTRARQLAEEGVERSLKDLDMILTEGGDIPTAAYREVLLNDFFTYTMKDHGHKRVTITPDKMAQLGTSRGLIDALAPDNAGAAEIKKVLDAYDIQETVGKKLEKATERLRGSRAREEIAGIDEDIANLLDQYNMKNGASELNELKATRKLKAALDSKKRAQFGVQMSSREVEELSGLMEAAKQEVKEFNRKGLKIPLTHINNMRQAAGHRFNALRMADPDKADEARRVRDIVAPIGMDEVPEYGRIVRSYKLSAIAGDAQEIGERVASDNMNYMDLLAATKFGKVDGRARSTGAGEKKAIRVGAGEGLKRSLGDDARSSPARGAQAAFRLADSKKMARNVNEVLGPKEAKEIGRVANNVVEDYERFKKLAAPTSMSEMAQERQFVGDILTGAAFGNLGGAGRAALLNRVLTRLSVPRGDARQMIEVLADPDALERALAVQQKRGLRLGPLGAAILASLGQPNPNAQIEE